jgi:RES domain-containing protein
MILYRISRQQYAADLSGKGGLISSARWHDHIPVIYASLSSSTAILEKLVHLQLSEIHHDLKMVRLEIPDNVSMERLSINQLSNDWRAYPAPDFLKRIGNAWLAGQSALLLHVPSVIDPMAENVLINPAHNEISKLKILDAENFSFDSRLKS